MTSDQDELGQCSKIRDVVSVLRLLAISIPSWLPRDFLLLAVAICSCAPGDDLCVSAQFIKLLPDIILSRGCVHLTVMLVPPAFKMSKGRRPLKLKTLVA